jgi:hypothetical protein
MNFLVYSKLEILMFIFRHGLEIGVFVSKLEAWHPLRRVMVSIEVE